jgi:hypothetical protein
MRRSTLALFIAPTLVAALQAVAAGSMPDYPQAMSKSAAACEAARLASWFEVQRQFTDGNVDPAQPIPSPDECLRSNGRASAMAEPMNPRDADVTAKARVEPQSGA